jgi:hypothetical protein
LNIFPFHRQHWLPNPFRGLSVIEAQENAHDTCLVYKTHSGRWLAVAAGGLSANGCPRLVAKLGRPSFGDVIAIFALPGQGARTASP